LFSKIAPEAFVVMQELYKTVKMFQRTLKISSRILEIPTDLKKLEATQT
jgi:hypothetical protein